MRTGWREECQVRETVRDNGTVRSVNNERAVLIASWVTWLVLGYGGLLGQSAAKVVRVISMFTSSESLIASRTHANVEDSFLYNIILHEARAYRLWKWRSGDFVERCEDST